MSRAKSIRGEESNPENKTKLNKDTFKKSLRIFKYIKPYLWYFVLAMLFLVAGSLIFMALMGLPGEMANVATGNPTTKK